MNRSANISALLAIIFMVIFLTRCGENPSGTKPVTEKVPVENTLRYGGFDSQVKWGQHLVKLGGCSDCHTPKKMTEMGPLDDSSLFLSGHPAKMPPPDVNRAEMERKGIAATNTQTAWVGAWGISYSSNLTPDSTGIGDWTEAQFLLSLKQGKWKGLQNSRTLLPPMPWQNLATLSDDELKAMFAFLTSIKPVKNVVPMAVPPVLAPHH